MAKRQDQRIREEHDVAIEVLEDVLHMLADLNTLIADELTGPGPVDTSDLRDVEDLVGSQREQVQRSRLRLFDAERPSFQHSQRWISLAASKS